MSNGLRTPPRCLGFGEHEDTCQNSAGSSHSKLWCQRCDDLRMAYLDAQFKKIEAGFNAR